MWGAWIKPGGSRQVCVFRPTAQLCHPAPGADMRLLQPLSWTPSLTQATSFPRGLAVLRSHLPVMNVGWQAKWDHAWARGSCTGFFVEMYSLPTTAAGHVGSAFINQTDYVWWKCKPKATRCDYLSACHITIERIGSKLVSCETSLSDAGAFCAATLWIQRSSNNLWAHQFLSLRSQRTESCINFSPPLQSTERPH